MDTTSTDRIEKKILLRAPLGRVWNALTDVGDFGRWFGVELTGTFAPGATLQGRVTHEKYRGLSFQLTVDRMEPERLVSWRWHPAAVEVGVDYRSEPTTLVVFELEKVQGGTRLTVVESGFDRLPLARRAEALRMNTEGWTEVLENMARQLDDAT